MQDGFDHEEDELQNRQSGRLYPIGRSLRSTFPAPDGEELQPRITSLMVELAHQPFEQVPCDRDPSPVEPAQHGKVAPPSILHQLTRLFWRD